MYMSCESERQGNNYEANRWLINANINLIV